jgi:glycosyltransferase XagB
MGEAAAFALEIYLARLILPPDGVTGVIWTADTSSENLCWLDAAFPGVPREIVAKDCLLLEAERRYGEAINDDASLSLARRAPELSAHRVVTRKQAVAIALLAMVVAGLLLWKPVTVSDAVVEIASAVFLANTAFRALLAFAGSGGRTQSVNGGAADDRALPVYTILVPLYREARVMPRLVQALQALDYPGHLLDIKLIVEADDPDTAEAAVQAASKDASFDVIRVPNGSPRTKPRACNYALSFARGEFTVIFDAEDRPEPDQLRKAIAAFRNSSRDVACLQARLNFYNAHENWLTRLFALDYILWFDMLLPGLDRLGVPMPLGGTSNHFRTSVLRTLGGWDPFNVTEDADLGFRIAQLGYRVSLIDSTTFEEAPITLHAWMKQRSRWLKGYMQTWLVHTRSPIRLGRRVGWRGWIAFQLFLGGTIASALLNPLLWIHFVLTEPSPGWLAISGLAGGNAVLTILAIISPRRLGWHDLFPYALSATFYWALVSFAAYRGLWQLITKPFYWEKTEHGISRLADEP